MSDEESGFLFSSSFFPRKNNIALGFKEKSNININKNDDDGKFANLANVSKYKGKR